MGSPISVVIAELTMQYFEAEALESPPCQPLFWKRYVDDCITALPADQIPAFTQHLNSINPNIQFTVELEVNRTLPFWTCLLTAKKMERYRSRFTVNRPTQTDILISIATTLQRTNVVL